MTNTASEVLLEMGSHLAGRTTNGDAAPTPDGPAVVCGKCSTVHTGTDIHRVECRMCNAILLASGIYVGGACPYAADCPVPYGKCHCGCGGATAPYGYSHPKEGAWQGAKGRFLQTHAARGAVAGVKFVTLQSIKPTRTYPQRKASAARAAVVTPVRRVLEANPGKTFTTQGLAKQAKVTPKQASTAFSTLKANNPSYQGTTGTHVYVPSGDQAAAATPTTVVRQWPHQRDGMISHRSEFPAVLAPGQQVHLSDTARELYEAFEKVADHNGRVSLSAANALKAVTRRKVAVYAAQRALTELHNAGCVDATNNRVKYLLQHPDGERFIPADPEHPVPLHIGKAADVLRELRKGRQAAVARAETPRALPTPYEHAEQAIQALPNVEEIDENRLGTALAKLMWERYEWALSEVGRLHEVVAEQKEQLDRCQALLAEQPLNLPAIARRMLTDVRE